MLDKLIMKLLIVTTEKDKSCERIIEEAVKRKIIVRRVFYSDMCLHRLEAKNFSKFDFCILRDPYNTGKDFSIYLRTIMHFFKGNVLDFNTYMHYPFYEDKLFQHLLFRDVARMPRFWHYNSNVMVDIDTFPVVVKKRIGSRGRDIFLIKNEGELRSFLSGKEVHEYLFEERIKVRKDIRVVVLGNKVIGAVEREVRFKERAGYRGIGVKVSSRYKIQKDMKEKALIVAKRMECDFCGIDFIVDDNGKGYLLECNVSPQFTSSERVLNINIAGKLVEYIVGKIKEQ